MCGIAGIVTKDGSAPAEGVLRGMSQALAHRGPDGEGIWIDQGVGLAHRRLAIIDLSTRALQPMRDPMDKITIVFNGEIYNYRELRQELGAAWKTESDTEVILEGYRVWGDDVVKRLRGMFAFAIWDAPRKRLLLARDRIGKKPLFYANDSHGDFVFASEIKAFRGVVDLKPDWNAVRLFLGLQYVPSPLTGFDGAQQLEPGTIGVLDEKGWRTEKYHAWNDEVRMTNDEKEIDEGIRTKLEDAVKVRQMAADVPVGAFLSGGVDSAAVVAFASRHAPRQLETFTMGFPNLNMDERKEARELANFFNTNHHEFEARPEHMTALVDTLVGQYDSPYADSSALPLWLLARETAKEIKVVLTGDGGDETFGGYRRYSAYETALRLFQTPILGAIAPPASYWFGNVFHDPRFDRMAGTVEALRHSPETAYGELFCGSYFATKRLHEVFTKEFLVQTQSSDAARFVASQMGSDSSLDAAMRFDLMSYLPDDLNVKMDRATMAFGLEARAPFLDQELASFSLDLPLNQKVNHGKTKVALKRALRGIVPDAVLDRPKKGFQVPLAEWFRGPLAPLLRERCLDPGSPLMRIVTYDAVERLIAENEKGTDHGNRLWMLLSLSTWLSQHV